MTAKRADIRKVRKRAEFQNIIGHGRRTHERFVTLYYMSTQNQTAVGFSIAKGVKRAVDRNQIRRRVREALNSIVFKEGYEIVFVVRAAAARMNFWQIREVLIVASGRVGILEEEQAL